MTDVALGQPATNWAGNYRYRATALHRPTSLEQLQEVVAAAPRVRVLGSRHSFTGIVDSAELVSLEALRPHRLAWAVSEAARTGSTVRVEEDR